MNEWMNIRMNDNTFQMSTKKYVYSTYKKERKKSRTLQCRIESRHYCIMYIFICFLPILASRLFFFCLNIFLITTLSEAWGKVSLKKRAAVYTLFHASILVRLQAVDEILVLCSCYIGRVLCCDFIYGDFIFRILAAAIVVDLFCFVFHNFTCCDCSCYNVLLEILFTSKCASLIF
jgi:hypothetical protein